MTLQSDSADARMYRSNPDAVECPLGDGLALYLAPDGEYFALNSSAARVWAGAREPASRATLLTCLSARGDGGAELSGVDPQTIAADLDALIGELEAAGLFLIVPASS